MDRSFWSLLLDFVAPPRKTDSIVRTLSIKSLQTLVLRGERVGSLPYHHSDVRALVWELKYYANKRAAILAAAILGDILITIASEQLGKPLLIPIPMHPSRRRARGHNQTETLCEALLPIVGEFFDYAPEALVRIHTTPQQQGLEKHIRMKNVAHTMHAEAAEVKDRTCVVIDDVSTTGATFAEATRALKAAGARHVECVALAYS